MTENTVVDRPRERTESTKRILAPDLARGLMLALIAVANIMIYLTDRPYGYRSHVVEDGPVDQLASIIVVTLVDGRSFPLFAFLLGYGVVQLINRRAGAGVETATIRRQLRRRSVIMIAIGAVHGVLLFPGEIIGFYGVVSLILLGLHRFGNAPLIRLAAIWLVPAAIISALIYGAIGSSEQRNFLWSFEMGHSWLSYGWRAVEWLMTPFALLPVISAALIGVVAARRRVLDEPWNHRRLLVRVAVGGIGIAVAGGLPSGLAVAGVWPITDPYGFGVAGLHALTGVAGGLGYAAAFGLIALAVRERAGRVSNAMVQLVAAAGQRSMSLYLSQSVLFVLLVSHRGLGWAAEIGTAAAAALALLVWLLGVLAAGLLARAGRQGPAEWLVRRFMAGRRATGRPTAGMRH